jgi:hypothetical protein
MKIFSAQSVGVVGSLDDDDSLVVVPDFDVTSNCSTLAVTDVVAVVVIAVTDTVTNRSLGRITRFLSNLKRYLFIKTRIRLRII